MIKQQNYTIFKPDYELERSKLENFLKTFVDPNIPVDPIHDQRKYMIHLQKVANNELKIVEILFEDLDFFFQKESDSKLVEAILKNSKRYIKLFAEAIEKVMPNRSNKRDDDQIDQIDEILMSQRLQNLQSAGADSRPIQGKSTLPKELTRKYEIIIIPGPNCKSKVVPMRSLRADQIGSIVSVKAIVVRTTDVKPFLKVATYSCDICGHESYQIINSRTFMPLVDCSSPVCKANQSRGKIYQMNRSSKFISFQEIKVQEPTDQVPVGHVPRSITIFALGECVKQCAPGDLVTIHGIYLPDIISGQRAFKSRLIHDTYIEAFKIGKHKLSYKDSHISDDMLPLIGKGGSISSEDLYSTLAKSIAPEIYGMEDIKKALLLLLVGGVNKEMSDGMKIRGNINVLLMGDPGVAKSQLLKYIANISPRGVYTTGKGSSGVGLTAAIVKDPNTNDLTLEGGALVLADMGVCCIDEFDKMSDYDRANIHEVMEQQTVSIAKAGITTRLNARSSVLAAANPLYGRYNKKLTPHQNINLPAALLSRFDLIFLLLDNPEHNKDYKLAKHVAYVHQHNQAPKLDFEPYIPQFIRSYIGEAKKVNPIVPRDLYNFIVQKYVEKRKEEVNTDKPGYQYITPRTLLAIIRLAQGLARLRFNEEVEQIDVNEALRLIDVSRSSINDDETADKGNFSSRSDSISAMYNILRESCFASKDKTIKLDEIERKILAKGFTKQQFDEMLEQYRNINVIYINTMGTEVTLL